MTDRCREDFERWCGHIPAPHPDEKEAYACSYVNQYWVIWQAAWNARGEDVDNLVDALEYIKERAGFDDYVTMEIIHNEAKEVLEERKGKA